MDKTEHSLEGRTRLLIEVWDDTPLFGHCLVGRWTVRDTTLDLIMEQLSLHGEALNPVARKMNGGEDYPIQKMEP